MNGFGKIAAFFIGAALVTGGGPAVHAVTPRTMEKIPQQNGASAGHVKVQKVAGVIKKIDGDNLLLETNQNYSLKGVKIVDLRGRSAPGGKDRARPRLAEMTFINDRLAEVVLR